MLASGLPAPALSFLRAMNRSLRCQQALGLGPRLIGDLGTGQHAGNLLAAAAPMKLIEAGHDTAEGAPIGRASCRERGEIPGGAVSLKKKQEQYENDTQTDTATLVKT